MKNSFRTPPAMRVSNLGRWRIADDLPPDSSKEHILCWFMDGHCIMNPSAARAHNVEFWQPLDPPPGRRALTAAPPTAAAPQADPPQITMADVRKHVGGGMVSSDDVIEAANVLLRERWQPQDDAGEVFAWFSPSDSAQPIVRAYVKDSFLPEPAARYSVPLYTAPPSQAADRMREASEHAVNMLVRCKTVLANMALENTTGLSAIYNRWPISHEPLRADAKKLVPLIKGALDWYHRAALSRADDNTPEQDSASAGLQSQSGINRSLSEGTPREGALSRTDDGKESEGGVEVADTHSGPDAATVGRHRSPSSLVRKDQDGSAEAGVAPGPSDPTPAEQREAVARKLAEKWPGDYMQGDDEDQREPNTLAYETADIAILSLLNASDAERAR